MKLIKTYLPVLFTVCLLLFNAHAALAEEIKDVEPGNCCFLTHTPHWRKKLKTSSPATPTYRRTRF